MRSYAVWTTFAREAAATNAVRFATREEGEAYGADLLSRWFVPTGFEVRESEDAVNYTFGPEGLKRVEDK